MITPDLIADAMLDPANEATTRKVVEALVAWDAFPPFIRAAYGREARRIARRAAVALVELLEVAEAIRHARLTTQPTPGSGRSAWIPRGRMGGST